MFVLALLFVLALKASIIIFLVLAFAIPTAPQPPTTARAPQLASPHLNPRQQLHPHALLKLAQYAHGGYNNHHEQQASD